MKKYPKTIEFACFSSVHSTRIFIGPCNFLKFSTPIQFSGSRLASFLVHLFLARKRTMHIFSESSSMVVGVVLDKAIPTQCY